MCYTSYEKRQKTPRMVLANQYKIRTFREKETYKYLDRLEEDTIKQVKMKDQIKKKYLSWTRKLLETKLCSRYLIKGINTWSVPIERYSGKFLKQTREKLKEMDQRTRKLMTMIRHYSPEMTLKIRCIKKGGRKRTCRYWRQRWFIDSMTRRLNRKSRRKIDYSHQKRYWQKEDKQNDNN